MIKPQELRVGNYIMFKSDKSIEQVQDIQTYDNKCTPINRVDITDVEGIQLTKEWLLKFGAIEDNYTPFFILKMPRNLGQIQINPNNSVTWLRHHRHNGPFNPESLVYVHQLQNFYFAFTGEELDKIS